ncbi:lipocalin-15-like [Phalacrocorax carbo]|uniref:lipocalin-15-like n=1 Tax=Phalacrocorax carbo TaxID=9209 RepID=UPI003119E4B0
MTVLLPSMVLALLCMLQAGADVPVQPGFNAKKFAGKWHVAAVVSNCSMFLKMKDGLKLSIATISFTPEGDLALKLLWPLLDRCQKIELLFQQSMQAGHYMAAQDKKDLRVMETDYSHYAIVRELQQSGQVPSTTLQLLTREQDVSPQVLENFNKLIPTVGLTNDTLTVLPKSGECQEDQCISWALLDLLPVLESHLTLLNKSVQKLPQNSVLLLAGAGVLPGSLTP